MSYLPMDCPICGRHRLIPEIVTDDGVFVRSVECEKCGAVWPEPSGSQDTTTGECGHTLYAGICYHAGCPREGVSEPLTNPMALSPTTPPTGAKLVGGQIDSWHGDGTDRGEA